MVLSATGYVFIIIFNNNNNNKTYGNVMVFPKYSVPLPLGHMEALYHLPALWDQVTRSG